MTVLKTILKGSICGAAALLAAAPALAQSTAEPSANAMANLVRLLVEQKVITQEAGAALIAQAETEAGAAQAKAAALAPPADGAVRVPYVPQIVKDEIKDELRKEVMAQAKEYRWVSPNSMPEWVSKVKISGDVRFRSQSNILDDTNATGLVDYARFNAEGPADLDGALLSVPLLNTHVDRLSRLSIRARLGVVADIAPGLTLGVRLASGNDDGPVSTTQLLGGGFNKKDIWLDRAYVSYAREFASLTLGRMPNPFVTSDILFDDDVNFDGLAFSANSAGWLDSGKVSLTGGIFPLEYVGDSTPNTSLDKARKADKWIVGGQLAGNWDFGPAYGVRAGVGYFDFRRVRGEVSAPCQPEVGEVDCSTDHTRPAFLGKGNTLMLLRDIVFTDPNSSRPQYVGLHQDYNVLNAELGAWADVASGLRVGLNGSFVKNLAFDASTLCERGRVVTNVTEVEVGVAGSTSTTVNGNPCAAEPNTVPINGGPLLAQYQSGDTGWMLRAHAGTPALAKSGEWNVGLGYKRIEPDAVLDSLNDSDFHLGGTNAKGYFVSGTYMLFDGFRLTGRYMSANEVYGAPFGIDVLQIDLVAEF